MCGGQGTRLQSEIEKPLLPIGDRPMVDHVLAALAEPIETTYAVVSPHTPETAAHLDVPCIETAGEGYVEDLQTALDAVEPPVLTVAADLPLLTSDIVSALVGAYQRGSLAICVPAELKRELGVSVDTVFQSQNGERAPAGVNVVGGDPDGTLTVSDHRLAVNVNRPGDAAVAEALL